MNQAPTPQEQSRQDLKKSTYQKPELKHVSTWQVITGSVGICTPQDIIDGIC